MVPRFSPVGRFKIDFERRLWKLYWQLDRYFTEGKEGDLFPRLFSVYTAIWASDSVRKNVKKS